MVWRLPERAMPRSSSQRMTASAFSRRIIATDGSGNFRRSAFQNRMRAESMASGARRRRRPLLDLVEASHAGEGGVERVERLRAGIERVAEFGGRQA